MAGGVSAGPAGDQQPSFAVAGARQQETRSPSTADSQSLEAAAVLWPLVQRGNTEAASLLTSVLEPVADRTRTTAR
jgi:hypothetical protein